MNMTQLLAAYPMEQIHAICLEGGKTIYTADVKKVEINETIGAVVVTTEDITGHIELTTRLEKPEIVKLYALDKVIAVEARVPRAWGDQSADSIITIKVEKKAKVKPEPKKVEEVVEPVMTIAEEPQSVEVVEEEIMEVAEEQEATGEVEEVESEDGVKPTTPKKKKKK